ncbi:diadenylate cyclase CdaA [Paenibacillus oryzisoli]|uniref:Diadenylate cyclase n=1 Tax=Paenibacillus whitsoniae TaxID=2496558 RepID=A0A430JK40_9BACL|nr:diadenylate cyclase CdaA [Paenibacillus whitsoniae]RTE11435.1 TIGR00159 family protein [Paenibacillus whitsoniae]
MDLLTSISAKDIVDILIVSYVIYKLILLVRGTRAIQLMKGILVVVIAWAVSIWFQLSTLQWMMNQTFTFGVLGVIVIFQPELRRALEQLGRGKIFSRASSEEDQDVNKRIGEVIRAANYLAKRKIGALIVFEKETGLTDYIESGIAIESKISGELLINIFIPNTPLHDGAVIIRQGQLMAAGCYLPLSENPFISKELGTRHRAAIGMTEVSDAMCVVVSEETGQISLSMNGHIVRDIKEESLIAKLFEELKPKAKAKEKNPFLKWWGRSNG